MKRYIDVDALIKDLKSMQVTVVGARSVSKTWLGKLINEYSRIIDRQPIVTDVVSKEEYDDLEYKLTGVMHFVDKWLDGDELEQDEVTRADIMREKILQVIESSQHDTIDEFARRLQEYHYESLHPSIRGVLPHTELFKVICKIVRDMKDSSKEKEYYTLEDIKRMSRQEIRDNLEKVLDSIERWK